MKRLSDLRFLFRVVVGLELVYALVAVLTPPSQVEAVTGWVLTADGQWLTKLLGLALASQAWVAWTLRNEPHLGVAEGARLLSARQRNGGLGHVDLARRRGHLLRRHRHRRPRDRHPLLAWGPAGTGHPRRLDEDGAHARAGHRTGLTGDND